MAITTLAGAIAGMQWARPFAKTAPASSPGARFHSFWALSGLPVAGSYDSTLNGVVLSSASAQVAGQIPVWDAASGLNQHIARMSVGGPISGVVMLCDRLWHNGGFTITSTGAQSITSPTWPARDVAGSTNGDGLCMALEVSVATGAGTPTITVGYTNSEGTAGRTATNWNATTATSVATSVFLINLQAGDYGVRSVQSLTLSATWTSGTINLVVFRPLMLIDNIANFHSVVDVITGGLPRVYDGSVPYVMHLPASANAASVSGAIIFTQG